MWGTQLFASATARIRSHNLPPSEMKSLYGSITRSAGTALSYVCPAMASPLASIQRIGRPEGSEPSGRTQQLSGGNRSSDYVIAHVDIAVRRLRIGADPLGIVDQALRDAPLDARNGNVEARAEEELALVKVEVDLGVDRHVGRKLDLLSLGRNSERAFETGRPAGSEQLLRIGARARRSGGRQLDVELAVGASRHTVFAAAGGVGLGRVDHLAGGSLLLECCHGSLLDGVRVVLREMLVSAPRARNPGWR